jgi:magnesium chelatase accessory protein
MIWERDGKDWPHHAHSQFRALGKHRWHWQEAGSGETVLLLHGTGASTHSWRHVFEPLAARCRVIALDLPGQGFTFVSDHDRCGLDEMSEDIASFLAEIDAPPAIIIGHSAGAAIAHQLALDLPETPRRIVSINGALEPFHGLAGALFPLSAKLMNIGAIGANLVSKTMSSTTTVRRLIETTGSRIDDEGIRLYQRLVSSSTHVDAVIAMMARWELGPLAARVGDLEAAVLLLVGGKDRTVEPQTSIRWAKRLRHVETIRLPQSGHLLHEEDAGAPFLAHLEAMLA